MCLFHFNNKSLWDNTCCWFKDGFGHWIVVIEFIIYPIIFNDIDLSFSAIPEKQSKQGMAAKELDQLTTLPSQNLPSEWSKIYNPSTSIWTVFLGCYTTKLYCKYFCCLNPSICSGKYMVEILSEENQNKITETFCCIVSRRLLWEKQILISSFF